MSDMFAITVIENIGKYLASAVSNRDELEAREHVAFANTLLGHVMEHSACGRGNGFCQSLGRIAEQIKMFYEIKKQLTY